MQEQRCPNKRKKRVKSWYVRAKVSQQKKEKSKKLVCKRKSPPTNTEKYKKNRKEVQASHQLNNDMQIK